MKMRAGTRAASLAVFAMLWLPFGSGYVQGATSLTKKAQTVKPETCGDVADVQECHENYQTGCSDSDNPRYDAYLNFLKNRTPKPTVKPKKILTQQDFKRLDDTMPDDLKPGHNAEHADELAALGQGAIYGLVGYLYIAFPSGVESTNCQLSGEGNVDYHIHIGFNPAAAKRLREGWQPDPAEKHDLQSASVIVEMTPHYRLWNQPAWSKDLLTSVLGRQVKVIGQLLADNEHARAKDSCAHPNADKTKCWRASIWELHPVTELFVCGPNAESTCTETSTNWVKLKDLAP